MRITWRHVVGFLAISVLALLITLTGPWAGAWSTAADAASPPASSASSALTSARSDAAPRCTRHATGPPTRRARRGRAMWSASTATSPGAGWSSPRAARHATRSCTPGAGLREGDHGRGRRRGRQGLPGGPSPCAGVELTGDRITLRNTTVIRPKGGDGDGIRFFGDDLTIAHNTVRDTDNSGGRHADCMQTFASDTPPSHRVRIEGNRCEQVDNMCLMAEGPNDGEGDGRGTTSDFVIKDNFCETLRASQALMFEDVQNVTIAKNTFAAPTHHAIGLAIHSTGAHVSGNRLHAGIRYEVGIDASSRPGYEGPEPGGAP
ncbi:right-handed parallel beta-helix repeat-containing protein [Streptomyces sp. FXJ1.4098]|nr:right-handed parallel beta-helix repeat-containing protein [Streptomyces sp. FXJ1.4098]